MKGFDSELQYLSELYTRLSRDLSISEPPCGSADASVAVDTILRNRDLFARIGQMNARLLQLTKEWETFSPHLESATKERTRELARKVQEQAMQLARMGEERLKQIETLREELGVELAEMSKGAQFLESVKPLKTNYPKFIDSQG